MRKFHAPKMMLLRSDQTADPTAEPIRHNDNDHSSAELETGRSCSCQKYVSNFCGKINFFFSIILIVLFASYRARWMRRFWQLIAIAASTSAALFGVSEFILHL